VLEEEEGERGGGRKRRREEEEDKEKRRRLSRAQSCKSLYRLPFRVLRIKYLLSGLLFYKYPLL